MAHRLVRVSFLLKLLAVSLILLLTYTCVSLRQELSLSERAECSYLACRLHSAEQSPTPLYLLTPTYTRLTQKADLVRLSQTLMHLQASLWIVVEDRSSKSDLVSKLLRRSGLNYVHLNVATSDRHRPRPGQRRYVHHRGVEQRNMGLEWLRTSLNPSSDQGVVYFMDDDNTYDVELFQRMRAVRRVGVWPVGLSGGNDYEGPVCEEGRVTGWYSIWDIKRKFPIDMSGFAINVQIILEYSNVYWDRSSKVGNMESDFLNSLQTDVNELETIDANCTRVLVWHTQTVKFEYLKDRMERIRSKGMERFIHVEV